LVCKTAERRQSQRAAVMFTATIADAAPQCPIKFRNLSSSGALVEGDELPTKGSSMLLHHHGQPLRGVVVWTEGQRGGVRFERPLNVSASLRHVSKPRHLTPPRSTRPGLRCKPLGDSEKQMLEQWIALGVTALGD
jgi:hypothetical protein